MEGGQKLRIEKFAELFPIVPFITHFKLSLFFFFLIAMIALSPYWMI